MTARLFFTGACFFLVFLSLVAARSSYAQDDAPSQTTVRKDPIPDAWLQEAYAFHDRCQGDAFLYQYYNCDCLAVKYLDKRIARPDASEGSILLSINTECADATQAAGYYYQQCKSDPVLMPPGIPVEKFCACYGNTYAKLFKHYKQAPSSKTFVNLQAQAILTCQDSDAAKKLYPPVSGK